ncbi:MAG TPA: dihydropteroate synthase [Mycobacteriales bacterium]|nr:dihydropteroate synthase [Mycobacteriales bacterium]
MGVLNVTPDSFSDGGAWASPDAAIKHGGELVSDGADIVDVGGESTRPGAARVSPDEELRRVVPVVRALAADGAVVSIDTSRSAVAAACVAAGALMVNDVTGGRGDPDMARVVAETGVAYVLMHSRGTSGDMQDLVSYDDVVATVAAELTLSLERMVTAGVSVDQVVLDPGLGFAKAGEHNLVLLAALAELRALGRPLLIGASRKSFLGRLLHERGKGERPVDDRDDATQAITAVAAWEGAWGVRVHAARAAADAVRVVAAIQAARP